MDILDRFRGGRLVARISSRAREISRLAQEKFAWARLGERTRRRLSGTALLLCSLVLGLWAYDQAAGDALRAWELRHPPGLQAWEHALGGRSLAPARPG